MLKKKDKREKTIFLLNNCDIFDTFSKSSIKVSEGIKVIGRSDWMNDLGMMYREGLIWPDTIFSP